MGQDKLQPEGQGETVLHSATTQVQPAVPDCSCDIADGPSDKSDLPRSNSPTSDIGEDACVARTIGCAMALTVQPQLKNRMEAASAQAVNRGHKVVTMIEVPDEEDDTTFRQWLTNGSPIASPKCKVTALPTPPESQTQTPVKRLLTEVTLPTVAMPPAASAKAPEAPH